MTYEEMRTMAEFLFPLTADKLANYISFSLQDKDLLDIEVQDPVCYYDNHLHTSTIQKTQAHSQAA